MTRRGVLASLVCAGLASMAIGCGSNQDASGTSTLKVASLPSAEAWLDGKSVGSTPFVLAVAPGRHELVLRQTGFEDQTEVVEVAAGQMRTVEGVLIARDAGDPDALKRLAAAFDVTVEPVATPELHRGAAGGADVMLLFPRNDVRTEGLSTWRVDVTPGYEGGGRLEFRKGRTVLHSQSFEPETLVTIGKLPVAVTDALKVGDTVTWGVWFSDRRKAITAQFEVVSKPQATKKLAAISGDARLARQPAELRKMLEAEALQNYRLYSEALVKFLEVKAASKDSTLPHGGIVACLRRMDLEGSALFTDSAGKLVATRGKSRNGGETEVARARVTPTTPGSAAPSSGGSSSGSGLKPGGAVAPGANPGTPPAPVSGGTTQGGEIAQPPVMVPPAALLARAQDAQRGADEARRLANEAASRADEAGKNVEASRLEAEAARARAEEARQAAEQHRDDAEAARYQQEADAAAEAARAAEQRAAEAQKDADAQSGLARKAQEDAMRAEQAAAQAKQAVDEAAKTSPEQAIDPKKVAPPGVKTDRPDPTGRSSPVELRLAADLAREAAGTAAQAAADARALAEVARRAAEEHAGQADEAAFADEAKKAEERAAEAEAASQAAAQAADDAEAKANTPAK